MYILVVATLVPAGSFLLCITSCFGVNQAFMSSTLHSSLEALNSYTAH
jgi:hypothetical protein